MQLMVFRHLLRIEQTLFALPFVLASLLLSQRPFSFEWVLVIPAFVLARISGMAFNQWIDCKIDALNPRTKNRMIPSGKITRTQACCIAWCALLLFMLLCIWLNVLTAILSCIAAILLIVYSYMKRIHYSCHIVLGLIHFLGPLMTAAALLETISMEFFFLGAVAGLLIIGNDIVYAIQDYAFDCHHALHSIPAKFGVEKSLQVAVVMHVLCWIMLWGIGLSAGLSLIYYFVLPFSGVVFIRFHRQIRKNLNVLNKIESAFFYCNLSLSSSTLLFIFTSKLWHVML